MYEELHRLAPLLISYNQGDQGFLNKAFAEWKRRPSHFQLPESFNYLLRQRGTSEHLTALWDSGVHVVHMVRCVAYAVPMLTSPSAHMVPTFILGPASFCAALPLRRT